MSRTHFTFTSRSESASNQTCPDFARNSQTSSTSSSGWITSNSYSSFEQRDFHYVQRVNNFGMRGQDIAAGKSANSYRILMLGDSFTMGKGVEDNQTFSVLLQKSLRQRVAACGGRFRSPTNSFG